jgi:hypothetical protein
MGAEEIPQLRRELAGEDDPAERARITVKLGDELLREAGRMYRAGAYTDGDLFLADYLKAVQAAFDALQQSGRDARRKPKGFKDLEIHLRKSQRTLEDLLRLVPYENRTAVEETKQETEEIRQLLLGQLMKVNLRREQQKEEQP